MIHLETDIEGEQMTFGYAQKTLEEIGYTMGVSCEYDSVFVNGVLHRKGGETMYVRLPFQELEGELDRQDAWIEFQKPFVIRHVVNVGLDKVSNSLIAATGFSQFQEPLDKDGYIRDKSKWQEFGEEAIGDILNKL